MIHLKGYHEYREGYHLLLFEYCGDIMIHVGDIISTVGLFGYSDNKR